MLYVIAIADVYLDEILDYADELPGIKDEPHGEGHHRDNGNGREGQVRTTRVMIMTLVLLRFDQLMDQEFAIETSVMLQNL